MADRAFRGVVSQGLNFIDLDLTLIGGGAGKAPTLGEGDLKATFFSQPTYTSTGIYTLTTADPYPGFVSFIASLMQATGANTGSFFQYPIAVQNANNTWTFSLNYTVSGSASDLLTGDRVYLRLVMRNSGSTQG